MGVRATPRTMAVLTAKLAPEGHIENSPYFRSECSGKKALARRQAQEAAVFLGAR
jgi:hypothetical protein